MSDARVRAGDTRAHRQRQSRRSHLRLRAHRPCRRGATLDAAAGPSALVVKKKETNMRLRLDDVQPGVDVVLVGEMNSETNQGLDGAGAVSLYGAGGSIVSQCSLRGHPELKLPRGRYRVTVVVERLD